MNRSTLTPDTFRTNSVSIPTQEQKDNPYAALPSGVRQFETGATRNNDTGELDYEGFFSPLALKAVAEYMHSHRLQPDGFLRDSDNWQKGIPMDSYMKSMVRHMMDVWLNHRGQPNQARAGLKDALCALMFNVQGYLHELEKQNG